MDRLQVGFWVWFGLVLWFCFFFLPGSPKTQCLVCAHFPLTPNSVLVRVVKLDMEDQSSGSFFSPMRSIRLLMIDKEDCYKHSAVKSRCREIFITSFLQSSI